MKKGNKLLQVKPIKFGLLLVFLFLCSFLVSSHKAYAFSGPGAGNIGSPYEISTCAQLQSINDDLDAYYKLTDDIDCAGSTSFNSGEGFSPIGSQIGGFGGNFDGQEHIIYDLDITHSPGPEDVGLFSIINNSAIVKNLRIDGTVTGETRVGMLAGSINNSAQAINIQILASVNCTGMYCGGLVGMLETTSEVHEAAVSATVNGTIAVGGILGSNSGVLENAYFEGTVDSSGGIVGGLVGIMGGLGSVTLSGASASITSAGSYTGGVIGRAVNGSSITTYVYFNGTINSTGSYVGGLIGWGDLDSIDFGYAAGTIVGNNIVGGLAGFIQAGSLTHLVSAMQIDSTGDISDPLIASFASHISLHTEFDYFDSVKSDEDTSQFGDAVADSSRFLGNSTDPIFDGWTFDSTHWRTNYKDYPSFPPLISLYVLCEAPGGTSSSVSIHCLIRPAGWGTPNWEFRYRKKGTTTWTYGVHLADIHEAIATISGLASSTTYEVGFRYAIDSDTSVWFLAEADTFAGKPVAKAATTSKVAADATASVATITTSSTSHTIGPDETNETDSDGIISTPAIVAETDPKLYFEWGLTGLALLSLVGLSLTYLKHPH